MNRVKLTCLVLLLLGGCSSNAPPPLAVPTGEHKKPINRITVDDALETDGMGAQPLRKINRGN